MHAAAFIDEKYYMSQAIAASQGDQASTPLSGKIFQ
jgi:hypothetical protein